MASKTKRMNGRNVDVLVCFNVNDYKFKTYILLSTYINPMVTTNQKHTIDTQKLKKITSMPLKKIIKPQRKRLRKEQKKKKKKTRR